jgi:pSer/pThr/pTyr-binding forkhead associated (FHA) protein
MKLSLVVLTPGLNEGKVLEIKLSQFVVGRDPQCHLRPASPMISKRHCAVLQREGKAFVRDFDSTNGTFVNNEPVKGEVELSNGDQLKIGPLLFRVRLEASAPVNRPTPPPPTKAAAKTLPVTPAKAPVPATGGESAADKAKSGTEPLAEPEAETTVEKFEAVAEKSKEVSNDDDIAAMLLSLHDEGSSGSLSSVSEVPEGSTIHEVPLSPEAAKQAKNEKDKPKPSGNTSSAAKTILEKYMKRPRA